MKNKLMVLVFCGALISCHKDKIDTTPEVKATIIEFVSNPLVYCFCCQGYRIQIDAKEYFTNFVPAPYQRPNIQVLIRYKQPEDGCTEVSDRIQITSIRSL